MRNKFSIISSGLYLIICSIICAATLCHPAAASDAPRASSGGAATMAVSERDKANIADLKTAESGVRHLEQKLKGREEDRGAFTEYERIKAGETNKMDELKKEVWRLQDSVKVLIEKEETLKGDKKKSDASLIEKTKAFKALEESIKRAADEIAAKDKQFAAVKVSGEKEGESRKERIDKLSAGIKAASDKTALITKERDGIAAELTTHDAEYREAVNKRDEFKEKMLQKKKDAAAAKKKDDAASKAEEAVDENELARLTKNVEDLTARDKELEAKRLKLTDEINKLAAENKSRQEELKACEGDDVQKAQRFKAQEEGLEKEKNGLRVNIEKLRKSELEAKKELLVMTEANKKLEDGLKQASASKAWAEKELKAKTDDLKLRVSAMLGEDERDNPLNESEKEREARRSFSSRGVELSAKLEKVFGAMKEENDRLAAENMAAQLKLRRAEQAAKAARRRQKQAETLPKELREKMDKERIDMHFNLAVIYERNGLYRDAEREYHKCLRIDPKDSGVHYNLGILYDDKLNNNKKAQYHYHKFLSFRPIGESAERVRDWITRLELENRLGKEMR